MSLARIIRSVPSIAFLGACAATIAADGAAQIPRFYLAAEIGLQDLSGSPFESLAKQLMKELAEVEDPNTKAYRDCLTRQQACLPIRFSVFTSSPWPRGESSVAVVVDSAAALDLDPLRRALGPSLRRIQGLANGWRDDNGVYLNQVGLAKNKHRLVVMFKVAEDPTSSDLFRGRTLPEIRRRRQRQLAQLRTAPAYALVDVIRVDIL